MNPTRVRQLVWVSLGVLTLCLAFASVSTITMDDDNLYLAYMAQGENGPARALEQRLIDRVAATPWCETSNFRLTLRQRYVTNYVGYVSVQGAVQHLAQAFMPRGPPSILAATLAAKALFLLAFSAALLAVAARGRDRELELAFVVGFIAMAAGDIAMHWWPRAWRATGLVKPALELVMPRSHSYFGVTPRNAALLLFMIALLLGWRRQWTWASLAILCIAPLHQTYGGLGLMLFSLAAVISYPAAFAKTSVRLLLSAAGLLYLWREHFFESLSVVGRVACALGCLGAALLGFQLVSSRAFSELRRARLGRYADREVLASITTLVAIAATVTVTSLVGAQLTDDPIARVSFYMELVTRIGSFVRLPAVMGIVLVVLSTFPTSSFPSLRPQLMVGCLVASAALSVLASLRVDQQSWPRLVNEIEKQLDAPSDRRTFKPAAEEGRIYAHLTMVAANEMDATLAETHILHSRPIRCAPSRKAK